MYKGNLNITVLIKSRVAQSVQHRTINLKVVVLSPTVGGNCSFRILTRFWQDNWSHTNEIKDDVHPRYIGT